MLKSLGLLLLLALSLFAQTSGPLTNQRIIELTRAGVHQDELTRIIATAPEVSFDLTPAGEQQMMQAGVTEETIKAMAAREDGVMNAASQPTSSNNQRASAASVAQPHAPAGIEEWPRIDLFAGYSYLNVDTSGLTTSRQSGNGWEASAAFAANKWIAAEADFSGYYNQYAIAIPDINLSFVSATLHVHDYAFLGGPRVTFGPVFIHALFGGDTLTGTALGLSVSQTDFAAAFGGGVQSKVFDHHWAIRTSADYVLSHHAIARIVLPTAPALSQNNFRISGGIVFVVGGRR